MRHILKKHRINFLFLAILLFTILYWTFQDRSTNSFWKMLAIIATIISAYLAFRYDRANKTLDKIYLINYSPDASGHCTRVINYIYKEKDGQRSNLVNKQAIEEDEILFASVLFILGFMDDLAIAIRNGIADESLVKDSMGDFIMRISTELQPYIGGVDKRYGTSSYPYLTALSSRWNTKKGKLSICWIIREIFKVIFADRLSLVAENLTLRRQLAAVQRKVKLTR